MKVGWLLLSIALVALQAGNAGAATMESPGDAALTVSAASPVPTLRGVVLATSETTVAPQSPAPAATSVPSASQSATGTRYTVKVGDTLYSIAAAFGVKPADIQAANGLSDPNLIKVGQVLLIPGVGQPATPAPSPTATQPPASTATPTATQPPAASATPASAPPPAAATAQPKADPLFFEETGFRVANDRFWEYFNRRGGLRTFGYPISKEFLLFGFRVQFFQRAVLQLNPDGSVATMNLLDEGLMPYNRINSSTLPAWDGGMAGAAPRPGSEGYFEKLLDFVKERSPNQWNDLTTNFYKTFCETVRYEDAYPDGKQDRGIMPAINLELWGAPTSPPSFDPNNKNFVYLRFQRGIMHYDKTTGATQGLLLGDYLKSIITGWNLPPDLEEQARGSRFYRQYNPLAANGLNRPNDLSGTDMRGAFTRDGLVVIDPGHGGTQIGSAHVFSDRTVLMEKDLNLKVSLKMADLLRRAGRQVQLTRTADTQVNNPAKDVTGDGKMTLDDDLQARVDVANNSGAQLLVSVHFNGSTNKELRGAEIYYNAKRPFSDSNRKFAQMVLDNLLASTRAAGYTLVSRGIKLDEAAVGQGNSLYLLGPTDKDKPRATQMVGVLTEGAFLTNDDDADMARQEKFQNAVALGYVQAILQYLQSIGK